MSESTTAPAIAPDTIAAPSAPVAAPPRKRAVGEWHRLKRPADGPTHDSKLAQVLFDAFFAGAVSAGRWELENTSITEAEFDASITAVGQIEIGGHNPDGTHPRAPTAKG